MLRTNRYTPVATTTDISRVNRYAPATAVPAAAPLAAVVKPSPVTPPVATPKPLTIAQQYGLPESTLSQGKAAAPEKQSLWNKVVRAVLPDKVEDFFGMNKTPIQKQIETQGDAQTEYMATRGRGLVGNLKESYSRGNEAAKIDTDMYSAMMSNDPNKYNEVNQRKQILQAKEANDPIKNKNLGTKTLTTVAGMAPAMLTGNVQGKVLGAGAGAAALIAGQLGPQVGLPEELVTVPTAYKAGEMLGGMQYWYRQGAGSMYGVMRDEGIDHDTSKWLGSAAGVPYAAIEFSQVDKIVPGLNKLAKQEIASLTKRSVASMVQKYGKNWATEVGEEGMQQFITGITTEMGKWMDDKVQGIPVAEALWKVSKQSVQTMIDSALPMLLMTAPNVIAEGSGAYDKKAPVNNASVVSTPSQPLFNQDKNSTEEAAIPTTRVSSIGGIELELPVASAVEATFNEEPLSSGFHFSQTPQQWKIIYNQKSVTPNLIEAAQNSGMDVSVREAPVGTGQFLTEISLPGVKSTEIKKAFEAFNKFADNYNRNSNQVSNNEQAIDPSQSIEEINNQYRAAKPGQKKFNASMDAMVKDNTMFPEDATILKTLFENTKDEFLDYLNIEVNGRLKRSLGRVTWKSKMVNGRQIVDESKFDQHKLQMQKGIAANGKDASGTFVHEYGHAGYYMLLTSEERAVVDEVYKKLGGKAGNTRIFEGSLNKNPKYHGGSVQEFFAQSFSEYVFEHKVPAQQMEPLLKRVSKKLFDGLKRLVNRGNIEAMDRIKPVFDKILAGDKSTPLTEFANREAPSFKTDIKTLFDKLDQRVTAAQGTPGEGSFAITPKARAAEEAKSLFKGSSKEVPVETLMPQTAESPAGMADEILEKGKEGLPPDIGSTIEPLEAVIEGEKHTPLNERIRWMDYLRTPWKVFDRMKIRPAYQALLKGYEGYVKELPGNIDKITAWSKRVSAEGNEKIFKYLDGEEIALTAEESQVAKEIKVWLSEWADRLGMSPDDRISDYITHIFPFGKGGEIPEEIAFLINKKIPGSVYDPFLLQRQGAKGYIQNTWKALDAYVKRATRKVNMDPALAELKEASSHLTDTSQLNYLNSYLGAVNMRPTTADTLIDNHIKEKFGYLFGARPTATITRSIRMMIARAKIGGSITSFAKNLTQGVNTFTELGGWYTTRGYIDLVKFGGKELRDNGVLIAPFIEDRTYSAVKKMAEKFDNVLFVNMNASELVNRGAAYYGAKAKFAAGKTTNKEFREALGKEKPANYTPTKEDAIAYGKFVAAKTQFLFGSLDTPVALNSDIAKMVAQFQTFGLKQTEFIGHMIGQREWRKLIRYIASSMLLFSYIGGAFGMKWDDSFKTLRWGMPPAIQFFVDLYNSGVMGVDKYGNKLDGSQRAKVVGKSLFTNIVPAGAQIQRTVEGLSTVDAGKETTGSGKFKYKVAPTTENYISGALFGKFNLPESKKYYQKQEDKKKGKAPSKSREGRYNPI